MDRTDFAQVLVACKRGRRGYYRTFWVKTNSVWTALAQALQENDVLDPDTDTRYPVSVLRCHYDEIDFDELKAVRDRDVWLAEGTVSWNARTEGMPYRFPTGVIGDGAVDDSPEDSLEKCFATRTEGYFEIRCLADQDSVLPLWQDVCGVYLNEPATVRVSFPDSTGDRRVSMQGKLSIGDFAEKSRPIAKTMFESGFVRVEFSVESRDVILRLMEDKDLILSTRSENEFSCLKGLALERGFRQVAKILDFHTEIAHWHYEDDKNPANVVLPDALRSIGLSVRI